MLMGKENLHQKFQLSIYNSSREVHVSQKLFLTERRTVEHFEYDFNQMQFLTERRTVEHFEYDFNQMQCLMKIIKLKNNDSLILSE